jgi:hypothetical protein
MPLIDREFRKKQNARVLELLREGLTPKQVHLRTGVGERQILRLRKRLKEEAKVRVE